MVRRVLMAAVPLLLFAGTAQAKLIDHFVDPFVGDFQLILTGSIEVHYDDTLDAVDDFLGDERDVVLTKTSGPPLNFVSYSVNGTPSALDYSAATDCLGSLLVEWDGAGEGDGVLGMGLSEDLSNEVGWEFRAKQDHPAVYTLRFYSSAADYYEKVWSVGVSAAYVNYSAGVGSFTATGTPDWASIKAVTFLIDGPELDLDVSVDYLQQTTSIPEPGTLALLGSGLALVVRRRRRK